MVSHFFLDGLCDVCRCETSEIDRRLLAANVMDKGNWIGGFTREKCEVAKSIRAIWEGEITCRCLVLRADMEEIKLCSRHLKEIVGDFV